MFCGSCSLSKISHYYIIGDNWKPQNPSGLQAASNEMHWAVQLGVSKTCVMVPWPKLGSNTVWLSWVQCWLIAVFIIKSNPMCIAGFFVAAVFSVYWLSNEFLWMDSWSYSGKESRWNLFFLVNYAFRHMTFIVTFLNWTEELVDLYSVVCGMCYYLFLFITGSIAPSANLPVFSLLEADFEVFRRAGATRCTDGGEIWPSSMPNFTPIGATTRV